MYKILVNGGAAINIMLMVMFRRLGKGSDDLIRTNAILKNFEGATFEVERSPKCGASHRKQDDANIIFRYQWEGIVQPVAWKGLYPCELFYTIHDATNVHLVER
jgi:hypothetical protein